MMQKTVLIVDDNEINRALLANMLRDYYTVIEASGGTAALEMIRQTHQTLSAVLLDIVMPDMDGYAVLRHIRDHDAYPNLPVIMVTASGDETSRTKALALGANDFIQKPYNPEIIRHCLKNTITQYEASVKLDAMRRDKLTGLLNRAAFFERVAELIAAREPGSYILSSFDIDNFKLINAQFGTVEGDRILREIGETVAEHMESAGCVGGRISGDNFALLVPTGYDEDSVASAHLTNRSVYAGKQPVMFSVGRYIVTDLSLSPNAMYDRAYIAKQSVKGRYDEHVAYFDESMLDKLMRNQQIVAEMETAVAERQFEVWYQPQRNHVTGALVGAEALVRWRYPKKGLIPPIEFIPIFEQNGFIYELDKFVWEETCRNLRRWIDEGRTPAPISVNISRQDIFRPGFVGVLTGLMEKYRLPTELVRLEITESAFAESTALIVEVVKRLIDLGFTVEIDDFGSGYSSLNTLKNVPAQVVKLDMRFLEDDSDSERGGNILGSVVRMTKWLGMSVIAEGVEEKAQADYLASIGCSYIQGYFYSKPLPVAEYEAYCEHLGTERSLSTMDSVENLDNNALWDPKSMDTLVFSNYVGAACIFEYYNGKLELLRSNRKFAAILGVSALSAEDTLKLDWMSCLAPESRELVREVLKRSCETKDEYTNEYLFCNIPGAPEKTYLRGTMRVIATSGDRWLVYCTSENITAQREAEANEKRALMYKELASGQMQAILDNVDVGIVASVIKDGVTSFLFANEKYYEILGYTKEQFEAEIADPYDTFAPQDRKRVRDFFLDRVSREESGVAEAYMLRRDGTKRLVRDAFSTSHFVGIFEPVQLSIFRDITDEREVELNEMRAAEQIAAIMRGVGSGIIAAIVNDGGKIELLFTNDMYYDLHGYTKAQYEAEVTDVYSLIHPDDRQNIIDKTLKAYTDERPVQVEYRVVCRDGSIRWLRVDLSSTHFSGIRQNVHLCVFNDMTAEREADQKLIETDEQLQFLVSMSNELLAQPDTELGVSAALAKLMGYFEGNRAYIFEMDGKKKLTSNTYEVCGEGVSAEKENLQELPLYLLDYWIDAFERDGYYAIRDVAALDESRAEEKAKLLAQGITSLFVVPLRRDGQLIGMMGVDDPRRPVTHYDRLIALGDYIAVMLTRRDLARRITKDNDDLTAMMNDMPGGFVRMRLSPGGAVVPFYFNEGFERLTGMNRAELREAFLPDILSGIHPEDRATVGDAVRRMIETGQANSSRYRIRHKTETYIWVTTFGRVTVGRSGESILNAYFIDVTGQMRQEEQQKALMDNMPCGAGIYEFKDGRMSLTYQNKIYWELVGLNEEMYPDESEMSAVHPDDLPMLMGELSAAIEQRRDVSCEINLRHLTRGYRLVRLLGRIVFKESGGFLIYATFSPIPDVVLEARQRQAQLALLTNSIPGGIAAYQGRADALDAIRLVYFSDGFCRLFGYSREEYEKLAKANPLSLVASDDAARMRENIVALVRDGKAMDYIYRAKLNGGGTKWINVKAVTGEPNGDLLTVNAVFFDVTEQKEALEKLRMSEEVNRLAIQQSMSVVCRYDVATRTLTIPDNANAIFQADEEDEDVPYKPVREGRVSPDTADQYIAFYERIMHGEKKGIARFQRASSQGWRWIEAHFTTIFADSGEPVTAVISIFDVTENIEKEAAYQKWKQSLSDKAPENYSLFRCSVTRSIVLETNEGLLLPGDQLDNSTSLEKRNASYADTCVLDEDRQRYLAFVSRDAMLLRYSRGRRSDSIEYREKLPNGDCRWLRLSVDFIDTPYSSEVEAFMMFENIDEAKRAELALLDRAEKDQLTGTLNRGNFVAKVGQRLQALKKNAMAALFIIDLDGFKRVNDFFGHSAGDEALVEIGRKLRETFRKDDLVCRLGGDEFMVYMQDVAFLSAVRERAALVCALLHKSFSLEVQLSASIGIAISPSHGTDFETLYRKADAALYHIKSMGKDGYAVYAESMAERELSFENAAIEKAAHADEAHIKPKRRMLIVEDNEVNRVYLTSIFEDEYIVETAADGASALTRLNRYGSAVSVVLLDLMMPGVDGFTVLKRMRESAAMQGIPAIVVSAMSERENILEAVKAGASDYITKPVDAELLKLRVTSAIGKAENEQLRAQNQYLAMQSDEAKRLAEARAHTEELSIALHAAERADLAKSQFLSSMSHEIRTPLNAVIGYIAIAQSEMNEAKSDDERRHAAMKVLDCLSKSEVASRHLLTIVNDVLDMSAIESGKLKVDDSPFDFRSLITSLSVMFFAQAKAKGVDFEVRFEKPAEEWLVGDQLRINQVLTNLLGNAVKFTPEGGRVTLTITENRIDHNATGFRFVVADTGIGMTQEYLEHIWTPFEQAETTISRRFGGSGLGLSITKNLVDLMGGTIEVKSKSGVGSTFTVNLTLQRTEQPIKATEVDFSAVNALVVDDDVSTCDYIKLLFDRCSAKCTTCTSGRAAVNAFLSAQQKGEPFNVCLVDWRMPQMDGFATISEIRRIAADNLPIVVVTAYDFDEIAAHAESLGINRFVAKPLFQSALFDLLATICGRAPAKTPEKASKYDFNGARILLVEDNVMNMEVAKHVLEAAKLAVDCAWNGQEAVDMFSSSAPGTYKAILMDVHMPVMDGYQATRLIRGVRRDDAPTVPVIAMTADVFAEDVEQARNAGMNAHVAKPVNVDSLFKVLASFIQKGGQ